MDPHFLKTSFSWKALHASFASIVSKEYPVAEQIFPLLYLCF